MSRWVRFACWFFGHRASGSFFTFGLMDRYRCVRCKRLVDFGGA